jgi:hypothetical protein
VLFVQTWPDFQKNHQYLKKNLDAGQSKWFSSWRIYTPKEVVPLLKKQQYANIEPKVNVSNYELVLSLEILPFLCTVHTLYHYRCIETVLYKLSFYTLYQEFLELISGFYRILGDPQKYLISYYSKSTKDLKSKLKTLGSFFFLIFLHFLEHVIPVISHINISFYYTSTLYLWILEGFVIV